MRKKRLLILGVLLLATISLTAVWRWTPLADWFTLQAVTTWVSEFKRTPTAPLWILAAFVVAGQVFFPITLLSLATVFAFGAILGTAYSTLGSLLAGVVTYFMGRMIGEETACKLAGPRLEKVRQQMKKHGLATSITVHILPVAPFTLVNLFSGACGLGLRDFILGTLIGHLPGAVSVIIFENQLTRALRSPDPMNIALLVIVVAALALATLWLQRRIAARHA